ncbi:hypothetical protein CISG_09215 [Coccidioides immitis RMSCC 3703]|uniref:Uncharacterized protein n=1 Tax=Coccidioides immitis RMSCC 3703 TaxID=454286 RepID=A0A0J8U433_COCIT|nr:hypothetical protein CISG_09215 [Coccidioides immitis RMSCC 3703]
MGSVLAQTDMGMSSSLCGFVAWYSPQTNIVVQIDATLDSLDDVNHPSRVIGGAFSDRSTPAVDRRGYPQRKNCSCAFSGSQPLFGLPFVTQADPYVSRAPSWRKMG